MSGRRDLKTCARADKVLTAHSSARDLTRNGLRTRLCARSGSVSAAIASHLARRVLIAALGAVLTRAGKVTGRASRTNLSASAADAVARTVRFSRTDLDAVPQRTCSVTVDSSITRARAGIDCIQLTGVIRARVTIVGIGASGSTLQRGFVARGAAGGLCVQATTFDACFVRVARDAETRKAKVNAHFARGVLGEAKLAFGDNAAARLFRIEAPVRRLPVGALNHGERDRFIVRGRR